MIEGANTEGLLLFTAGCTASVLLYTKPVLDDLLLFTTGCTVTVLLYTKPVFEGLLLFVAGGATSVLLYTLYWLCFLPFNRVCTVKSSFFEPY